MSQLPVIDRRKTNAVPCGTCTSCCQGDAIYLHPECGDDARLYQTEQYEGRTILAHKPNGDCIYLERGKGCTIWDRRPTICRELDCRVLVKILGEVRMVNMGLDKVLAAAWRLNRDGVGSDPSAAKAVKEASAAATADLAGGET